MLALRAERPALRVLDPSLVTTDVFDVSRTIVVTRGAPGDVVVMVLAFADVPHDIELSLAPGRWNVLLDSHAGERTLPAVVDSDGTLRLKLPPRSALLLGTAP